MTLVMTEKVIQLLKHRGVTTGEGSNYELRYTSIESFLNILASLRTLFKGVEYYLKRTRKQLWFLDMREGANRANG